MTTSERRTRLRADASAKVAARASGGDALWFPIQRLAALLADPSMTAPTNWLVPGVVPAGAAVLLYGSPKVGKTTLAAALVAAVASGRPFLGRPVTAGPVLLSTSSAPNA